MEILLKSCLCVSHGGCTVTVYRTKVSMTVYEWISGRPLLCHINQCSINRAVTMRVIFTHGITNDTGTFSDVAYPDRCSARS